MLESLKKISWFLKKRKYDYLLALSVLTFVNIVVVVLPWVVGKAIDSIATGKLTEEIFHNYIFVITSLTVSEYILNFIWGYKLFQNAILIEKEYISIIMKKIIYMKAPFFEKFTTGDLMTRATTNLSEIHEMMGFGVMAFADGVAYGGTILLAMIFLVSWKLTMLSIIPYAFLAVIINFLGKKIHSIYEENQKALADMSDVALEVVSGVRVVRAYNMDDVVRGRFAEKTEECKRTAIRTGLFGDLMMPISRIILTINNALAIGIGVILIRNGELTLGALISFTMYLYQLTWPMYAIGEFVNILQRGRVSIDRIDEILSEEDMSLKEENTALDDEFKDIEFKDYSFQYSKSISPNLSSINLRIKNGETLGIVGKTGSGKSTLIKQLLKEYDFGQGEIQINNKNLYNMNTESIMKKIGYVSQENILFSKSIQENIFFGVEIEKQTTENLMSAIRAADFEKDLFSLPQGLDTLVGERGVAVSGGQKQRISIARAIIKNPEILILDDSLSAVDSKTEQKIIKNIKENRKNKTNIIITHRISAVESADNIIVLDNGKIVEEGTHNELMALKGWYFEQYNTQKLEDNDEL